MKHCPPASRSAIASVPPAISHRRSVIGQALLSGLAFTFLLTAHAAPLTLDEAVKLALQNNQRVKVSVFSPQIARANVTAAYGAFDPTIAFNRSYAEDETAGPIAPLLSRRLDKTDSYELSLDGLMPWGMTYSIGGTTTNSRNTGTGFADRYVTFGGVSVTQPLLRGFGFGATLANLRVTKASRDISDWQHRQTIIDVITNVVLVYNNLQEARESVRIFRLSRDLAAKLYDENERKYRLGATSAAEVTQARARVANREESILIFERRVRDIENQLRLLIGDTTFHVESPPLEIIELEPAPDITVKASEDLKKAYELRPDYQAGRLGVTIDRVNNTFAQNQLLPRVDFVGSYGYTGIDSDFSGARQQVRDRDAHSYSAGLVVRVPLTFAAGRGRARAARLTLRQSEADLVRLEQDIAIAITAVAGQIVTTKQRVEVTRAYVDLAQQAMENEQKRFATSTSSTFLVSNAQQELAIAQRSLAIALADQRRAIASYDRELGTTLIKWGVKTE